MPRYTIKVLICKRCHDAEELDNQINNEDTGATEEPSGYWDCWACGETQCWGTAYLYLIAD
jgi:hypothetical protein